MQQMNIKISQAGFQYGSIKAGNSPRAMITRMLAKNLQKGFVSAIARQVGPDTRGGW
jgi:hypothetical protein